MNYATISVDANADNIRHHCTQRDGESSYRITGLAEDLTVYLSGTPAEMMRFALALQRAATAQRDREANVMRDLVGGGE